MTKAPISLQDLRRSLYVKAKAEPAWRFWGLYVHICKMETLYEAYQMAKENGGTPGIDGVTFETIEESGVEGFLRQIRDELLTNTYRPMRARKKEIPKDGGGRSAFFRFRRSAIVWARGCSSSYWSRSSKLISNRGRKDTLLVRSHDKNRSGAPRGRPCEKLPIHRRITCWHGRERRGVVD